MAAPAPPPTLQVAMVAVADADGRHPLRPGREGCGRRGENAGARTPKADGSMPTNLPSAPSPGPDPSPQPRAPGPTSGGDAGELDGGIRQRLHHLGNERVGDARGWPGYGQ